MWVENVAWDNELKKVQVQRSSQSMFVCLTTLLVGITISKLTNRLWRNWSLPRGPVGLPIIGYLPFLSENEMHRDFQRLGDKYGSIFSLYLGGLLTVVINDFEDQKESGEMDALSFKPPRLFEISKDSASIMDLNGKPFEEQKRFLLITLRNVSKCNLKVVGDQISRTIEVLKTKTRPKDFSLREVLSPAINNIILSLICGKTYEVDHVKIKMLHRFQFQVVDYFKTLRSIFLFPALHRVRTLLIKFAPSLKKQQIDILKFERALKDEIQERQKSSDGVEKKDYIDHYLNKLKQTREQSSSFSVSNLIGNCEILLMAGSETIRSTLEWTLICLARHQLIQDSVYQEIISVLGHDEEPEWKDRERLILVQALILEVMRYKTLLPIGDPRITNQDVKLKGYTIPKGTQILMNFWAVHNDKDYWGDPENFRPERFLSSDLKSIVNSEKVIPFGVGMRACPGQKLAEVEVFLFVTSLLQKFRFLPPRKGVCLDERSLFTQMAVSPMIRLELR